MQQWIYDAVTTLTAGINADPTLVPQQKANLVSFIQGEAASGGLMSQGAMSFGQNYAQLMSF
jgi:hypothetical protein